jgi:hypothetical protein
MSEAKFENVLKELRATAPPAPERLRDRVRALPEPAARWSLRKRPVLAAAVAIALAVGLGAAAIGGLTDLRESKGPSATSFETQRAAELRKLRAARPSGGTAQSSDQPRFARPPFKAPYPYKERATTLAPILTPGSRLQRYDVSMRLGVDDLSRTTQNAVRQTRRLGGYVAAANFSTERSAGDSYLDLRVPVQNVQKAIARFTELGTILSQRISVADLQAGVDRIDRRIEAASKVIAELEGKSFLTPDERAQLAETKRTVKRLSRSRAGLVREGTYATVSLQLTTRKPAAKQVAPGRFDRFWGNAGDILEKELIAVLYALVVAGPFAILAALALLAERARRRRADHRLLEETG